MAEGKRTISDVIDRVANAVSEVIPDSMSQEAERNLRALLQSLFDRLDLVTREELEVQEAVLARTRVRLEEMEERISDLEEKLLRE